MTWFLLLRIYALILTVVFTGAIVFYFAEYISRGGKFLIALRGATKLLFLFYPMVFAVFLRSKQVIWPNQIVWRLYGVILALYFLKMICFQDSQFHWQELKRKIALWPTVSLLTLIAFFMMLVSPALVILCLLCFTNYGISELPPV